MPAIMIPRTDAEQPVGAGNDGPWPKGAWQGAVDNTRSREFPDWMGPNEAGTNGFVSSDGEILGLQLGSNRGLEGQDDVGAQKFFVDFIVRDGSLTIEDTLDEDTAAWQLQRSQKLLVNLAIALGATEIVEDEGGNEFVAVVDGFLDALRNGEFNGREIGYVVGHRTWTSGDKSGVDDFVREFVQAV